MILLADAATGASITAAAAAMEARVLRKGMETPRIARLPRITTITVTLHFGFSDLHFRKPLMTAMPGNTALVRPRIRRRKRVDHTCLNMLLPSAAMADFISCDATRIHAEGKTGTQC
jgi:hypothetical protein